MIQHSKNIQQIHISDYKHLERWMELSLSLSAACNFVHTLLKFTYLAVFQKHCTRVLEIATFPPGVSKKLYLANTRKILKSLPGLIPLNFTFGNLYPMNMSKSVGCFSIFKLIIKVWNQTRISLLCIHKIINRQLMATISFVSVNIKLI